MPKTRTFTINADERATITVERECAAQCGGKVLFAIEVLHAYWSPDVSIMTGSDQYKGGNLCVRCGGRFNAFARKVRETLGGE
jgi:hypothetical protein